ncbi:Rtr1/RPAP2 family-domain-containing protein [Thamnocephalis sphaerospora]|uniref:RNA polymerase II subunit B1 CTD phosphatase RPAP2 homolog n=1 Tax=Thamnocephalis sphaerospora TaxID=78915 RepID=A0A4P9XL10_9FUNG|nr:Rtr1/RPAP2 family-domain-containing protein [Thamnocephalis sphaerospora]|eukprot:RKP06462.1 Rtr1/RPAP2 family-domain-containing protein [Thamnocephalis sphaerospora]
MNAGTDRAALLAQHQQAVEEWEAVAFEWQERLSEPCSEQTLIEAARYMQPRHYLELLEEREANELCGYPACDKPPKSTGSKYKIDFDRQLVYDQSSQYAFCSKRCHAASRFYETQLQVQPVHMREPTQLPEIKLLPTQGPIRKADLEGAPVGAAAAAAAAARDHPIVANLAVPHAAASSSDKSTAERHGHSTEKDMQVTPIKATLAAASKAAAAPSASSNVVTMPTALTATPSQLAGDTIMRLVVRENPPVPASGAGSQAPVRPPSPSRAYAWDEVEGMRPRVAHRTRAPRRLANGQVQQSDSEEEEEEDSDTDFDLSQLRIV